METLLFLSQEQLLAALQCGPCRERPWLLGVDGEQGTGKSTLAKHFAQRLGASVVSGDDFIRNGKVAYPQTLDLAALSERLTNAQENGESIIIESVMLQLILQAINAEPAAIVYVRHNSFAGVYTQPYLFDATLLAEAIERDNEIHRVFFPTDDSPSLAGEILNYHLKYLPQLTSTHLLEHEFSYSS